MRQEADRLREDLEALVTQAHQQDAEDEAARQRLGTTRRGKAPQPVDATPADKAQTHFTAPELQSRRTTNKGWEYCGHAPARVEAAHQLILAWAVTAEAHDTQQAEPMAQRTVAHLEHAGIAMPTDAAGATQRSPATDDSGDYSEAAAVAGERGGFDPYRATGRQRPQAGKAAGPEPPATAQDRRAAQGRTPTGRALYARRKVIVEPVWGQSKAGRGGRRFLRRGLAKMRGEWRLVGLPHKLLKMWRHACAPITG